MRQFGDFGKEIAYLRLSPPNAFSTIRGGLGDN